ncbi:MAG: hypothetical protein FJ254_04970 [Phycisphaerae bacterium]|nr:hypothetical protein [Phycisphaerae bacterium]
MNPVLTDTARVLVTTTSSDGIVVKIPGTQYQLAFLPQCPQCAFVAGERVHARFRATALKMHHPKAGGIFVEPSEGHPRNVQGRVIATDTRANMVLADVVVPMWITMPQGQAASEFATGDLVNFSMQSGSTIERVR